MAVCSARMIGARWSCDVATVEGKASCRRVFVVSGDRLLAKMTELKLTEAMLADAAGVSEQTIRNYVGSTQQAPWFANSAVIGKVSHALKVAPGDLQVPVLAPDPPNSDRALIAEMRFLADPQTVRTIGGMWNAVSIDLEIPGFVTYKRTVHWHAVLEVRQNGNLFEAEGKDKDNDGVFASGTLFEDGNWLRFNYWIDNSRLREYGTAMAEYKGDGKTIDGIFVGRDGPHESSAGLVVSRITLTRAD